MLRDSPHVAAALRERHRNVIIDEYQDTCPAQMDIVHALCAPTGRVTAVGDERQSIYGFRGADPQSMSMFQAFYAHPQLTHTLQLNYRSSPNVLAVAAAALAGDDGAAPAPLRAARAGGPGEPVTVMQLRAAASEAAWMAARIGERIAAGTPPGQIAALYRKFRSGRERPHRALAAALDGAGIPYRIVREVALLKRVAVADLLAYAALLLDPDDDAAFARVLNVPPRRCGPAVRAALLDRQAAARVRGVGHASLAACAAGALAAGALAAAQAGPLRSFLGLLARLRAEVVVLRPAEVLDRILQATDYLQHLEKRAAAERRRREAKGEAAPEEEGGGSDDDAGGGAVEGTGGSGSSDEESDDEEAGGPGQGAAAAAAEEEAVPQQPYELVCRTTGPLHRLICTAIAWTEGWAPRVRLAGDDGARGGGEPTGPPALERLCFAALCSPAGMAEVRRALAGGDDRRAAAVLAAISSASACGPVVLAEFLNHLTLDPDGGEAGESGLSAAERGVVISTVHAAQGLEWCAGASCIHGSCRLGVHQRLAPPARREFVRSALRSSARSRPLAPPTCRRDVVFCPRLNDGFLPAAHRADDVALLSLAQRMLGRGPGPGPGPGEEEEEAEPEVEVEEEEVMARDAAEHAAEERRLAHVALTRALHKLFLSHVREGVDMYGSRTNERASPILEALLRLCPGAVEQGAQPPQPGEEGYHGP